MKGSQLHLGRGHALQNEVGFLQLYGAFSSIRICKRCRATVRLTYETNRRKCKYLDTPTACPSNSDTRFSYFFAHKQPPRKATSFEIPTGRNGSVHCEEAVLTFCQRARQRDETSNNNNNWNVFKLWLMVIAPSSAANSDDVEPTAAARRRVQTRALTHAPTHPRSPRPRARALVEVLPAFVVCATACVRRRCL